MLQAPPGTTSYMALILSKRFEPQARTDMHHRFPWYQPDLQNPCEHLMASESEVLQGAQQKFSQVVKV